MNISRNTIGWFVSDTISVRHSLRPLRGVVPSMYDRVDTVGLSLDNACYLLFMRLVDVPEVWWRNEENEWDWEPLHNIAHIWGVDHEYS